MARTKQRRTYLPYTFPAIAGTHLVIYRPRDDRGLSKPRPRVQRATGPRLLRDSPQTADSNPRPRGRWSSTLTTRPSRNPARSLPSVIEDRHAMSQSAFQGKVPKCPGSVKPASVATPHGESRHQVLVNYRMFIIVPTGRYGVVDDSRSRRQYRYYYYYHHHHHAGKFSPLTHPRHEDYDVVKLNTPCPPAQATGQCI